MSASGQRPFREVITHSLIYGSGYVSIAAAGFFLVPVYTAYFTPAEFGLLALMLVFYGLMGRVYDLGFMNSVGRYFFECKGQDAEQRLRVMATTGSAFLFSFGIILTALLWMGSGSIAAVLTGNSAHAGLVRMVAVTLFADSLTIVPLTLLRMEERSGHFILVSIARFAVGLTLNIVFVAVLGWGVAGALAGGAITAVLVVVLLLPEYRRRLGGTPSLPLLKEMLQFGLPFFPVLLSGWAIEASDRYILELYRGRTEVGFYALSYKIAQIMQIAVTAFSMGWAPLRYKVYERPDAVQTYRLLAVAYIVGAAFLSVGVSVFGGELVVLLAPPSYAPAASVIGVLVLSYMVYGLYLILLTGMGVTKKTAAMGWIASLAALLNLGLNFALVPRYGMAAAAGTTLAANVVMAVGGWYFSQRVYPIDFEWAIMARVAGLIVAALVVDASWTVDSWGAGLAASTFIWCVFTAVLLSPLIIGTGYFNMLRSRTAVILRPRRAST